MNIRRIDYYDIPYVFSLLFIFNMIIPKPAYIFYLHLSVVICFGVYLACNISSILKGFIRLDVKPNISLRSLGWFWWICLVFLAIIGAFPFLGDFNPVIYYSWMLWILPVMMIDIWLERRARRKIAAIITPATKT